MRGVAVVAAGLLHRSYDVKRKPSLLAMMTHCCFAIPRELSFIILMGRKKFCLRVIGQPAKAAAPRALAGDRH